MRTRKEIEQAYTDVHYLTLEVLLDIRDLVDTHNRVPHEPIVVTGSGGVRP